MGEDEETAEAPTDDAAEASPPQKRAPSRKKKRKRAEAAAEDAGGEASSSSSSKAKKPDAPAPLPGEGTAAGDLLREAHRLFEVGDYARLRAVCKQIEASETTGDADVIAEHASVRLAARALRRRTEVDPLQIVVVLACAAVFAAIVYHWVL